MFSRGKRPLIGKKKRSGGTGLGGLLMVGGLFAFTGLGAMTMNAIESLKSPCFELTRQIGMGADICRMFSNTVSQADRAIPSASSIADFSVLDRVQIPADISQFTSQLDGLVDSNAFQSALGPELASFIDIDVIRSINQQSGGLGDQVLSDTQRLSLALSQTAIGNGMLNGSFNGGSDPNQASAWFEQGASMGEFGILSQLSLGNMYASGTDIAPDFGRAEAYYAETLKSLDALQALDTPESRALLGSLPGQPDQLRRSLESQLEQLGR